MSWIYKDWGSHATITKKHSPLWSQTKTKDYWPLIKFAIPNVAKNWHNLVWLSNWLHNIGQFFSVKNEYKINISRSMPNFKNQPLQSKSSKDLNTDYVPIVHQNISTDVEFYGMYWLLTRRIYVYKNHIKQTQITCKV